jgi:hypothetical protein
MVFPLRDCIFLHSSGISNGKKVYLFAAGPHTGKTGLLLYLLKKGYKYVCDDHAIINENGICFPYTRRINLSYFNIKNNKWVKNLILESKKDKQLPLILKENLTKNLSSLHEKTKILLLKKSFEYFLYKLNFEYDLDLRKTGVKIE